MKSTRIQTGEWGAAYRITDDKGTWVAKKAECGWIAFECSNLDDCSDDNNWAVCFKTKRELIKYSQSF